MVVDTGFLVALLSRRDGNHHWAGAQARRFPPPWRTCEAVLSEAFHLVEAPGEPALAALALSHDAVLVSCDTDFARFKGLRWENPLG